MPKSVSSQGSYWYIGQMLFVNKTKVNPNSNMDFPYGLEGFQ